MLSFRTLRSFSLATVLLFAPVLAACSGDGLGQSSDDVTDVPHTDVERQSIGNCWLYAEASWVESLNLAATGTPFDVSQSYWTYWHWYEQVTTDGVDEIQTGGFFDEANEIILRRGIMPEDKFVKEDALSEMSSRQASALATINRELKEGRLASYDARTDRALVRTVFDEAWGLSSTVKGQMTRAFGKDYSRTLQDGGSTYGTSIEAATEFPVRYTERKTDRNQPTVVETTLDRAIAEWRIQYYPSYGYDLETKRRDFQIRVQRALHDRQPVVISWDVDFNAMESWDPVLRGSFNLTTLQRAGGPGHQGGHMTVFEDYEVETEQYGLLAAGVTLDPSNPEDQAKLEAALLPSSKIRFFRIKNSWGAFRDDRSSAPGFPGYHDLYMDYLNGPIAWCPDTDDKTADNCRGTSNPWRMVVLPPGY